MSAGQIAAAALLPPLGVYLKRGGGRDFWIAGGLTLLAFVPGMVFALWTVLRGEAASLDHPGGGRGPAAVTGEAKRET